MQRLRDHLVETDQKIAEGRARTIEIKRQITNLQQRGHNAIGSMGLLRELEHSIRLLTIERDLIARKLKRQEHADGA